MIQRKPLARIVSGSLLAAILVVLFACRSDAALPVCTSESFVQVGVASWHAPSRPGECRTASGMRWSNESLIAAHRSLPFGAHVRVVNLRNGRSVTVQIADRGPYARGRIIDLSRRAAVALDLISAGCGRVRLERVPETAATEPGAAHRRFLWF